MLNRESTTDRFIDTLPGFGSFAPEDDITEVDPFPAGALVDPFMDDTLPPISFEELEAFENRRLKDTLNTY